MFAERSRREKVLARRGSNQAFAGTVALKLGSAMPGFGDDHHDQIKDDAAVLLVNEPTLSIVPYNGFVPTIGDECEVMIWQTGLDGTLGEVLIDPFFRDNGIDFEVVVINSTGVGNLTLLASSIDSVLGDWIEPSGEEATCVQVTRVKTPWCPASRKARPGS